jgi:hypothetical protein
MNNTSLVGEMSLTTAFDTSLLVDGILSLRDFVPPKNVEVSSAMFEP